MKNIVTVGGGTGSYTILSGLKNLQNVSLFALVSMADNGGSTGMLRDELGVLPPGDVRQCLVALSDHSNMVRKLINYRFSEGSLTGHSFGNIFLAALEKVTGDFVKGVEIASEILKVKGSVIPVTKDKADLFLLLKNNKLIKGQVDITHTNIQKFGIKKFFYKKNVELNNKARSAILKADYIIIGPGDYYSSIIPNLIIKGFREAINKTTAKIIFSVNLTNKQGHTGNWKVSDYVKNTETYLGRPVDLILVNTDKPSKKQVNRYKIKEGDGVLVKDDLDDKRIIRKPLMSRLLYKFNKYDTVKRSFIRHDSQKITSCIEGIIKKDNVRLILDFDDTLFDTKKFKRNMFSYIEKAGIPYSVAELNYKKIRDLDTPFSLKMFLTMIFVENRNEKFIENLYRKIISHNFSFLNKELLDVVRMIGKSNCYLVTNGDEKFQFDKIRKSKIDSLFHSVDVIPGSKKKIIEEICVDNPDSLIIFVDDKKKFFDDIDTEKCKNLKTILFNGKNVKDIFKEINKKN